MPSVGFCPKGVTMENGQIFNVLRLNFQLKIDKKKSHQCILNYLVEKDI